MKEVSFDDAVNNVACTAAGRGEYLRELRAFEASSLQVAELNLFTASSPSSAATNYRRLIKIYDFPVKILERNGRLIAYKKQTYDFLYSELAADKYAKRTIDEVKERESREEFLKQWDSYIY